MALSGIPYDDDNVFKKIIAGTIPSYKIFETEHALAILDAFPMTPGHSLLLPKAPCASVLDMPPTVAAAVLSELPRLAQAVQLAAPSLGATLRAAHAAGSVAPSEQALPAGHALQPSCDVSPSASPYEPAAHGLATEEPAAQYPPSVHVTQAVVRSAS